MRVPVSESYVSYQGTGLMAGVRQFFIRTSGCSVKCPLRKNCDQPESLGYTGDEIETESLLADAGNLVGVGGWVHITGGEPLEHQSVIHLANAALQTGFKVQIQTSGSVSVDIQGAFLTVSPKQREIRVLPNEIVLVAAGWMTQEFATTITRGAKCPVYVIPEAFDGEFGVEAAVSLANQLQKFGGDVRLSLQSHILWGVK